LRLWAAVGEVYPQAQQQLCWNHKNVLDAVSHHLTTMMYAESGGQAQTKEIRAKVSAQSQSGQDGGGEVGEADDYYDFLPEHWKHLRTSNVVESPFSLVRIRTTASRRFKSQINATCLIWKSLMVVEMSFTKLNASSRGESC